MNRASKPSCSITNKQKSDCNMQFLQFGKVHSTRELSASFLKIRKLHKSFYVFLINTTPSLF